MEDSASCILVIIGATPEGKKALLGFRVGERESAQSWRALLESIPSPRNRFSIPVSKIL
jgi:transposase-like protein